MITLAASKGYLLDQALKILTQIGVEFEDDPQKSRKLFFYDKSKNWKLLVVRPWDVPEYVEEGAADIGITGYDVIREKQSQVLRLSSLDFGGCRLVLAGPKETTQKPLTHNLTVATKYPHSTTEYFQQKGLHVKIIKLYGAIELAPLTGLSDIVCDLTATGATLKEHDLFEIDTVFDSTAQIIANPVSARFDYDRIHNFVQQVENLQKKS